MHSDCKEHSPKPWMHIDCSSLVLLLLDYMTVLVCYSRTRTKHLWLCNFMKRIGVVGFQFQNLQVQGGQEIWSLVRTS